MPRKTLSQSARSLPERCIVHHYLGAGDGSNRFEWQAWVTDVWFFRARGRRVQKKDRVLNTQPVRRAPEYDDCLKVGTGGICTDCTKKLNGEETKE